MSKDVNQIAKELAFNFSELINLVKDDTKLSLEEKKKLSVLALDYFDLVENGLTETDDTMPGITLPEIGVKKVFQAL